MSLHDLCIAILLLLGQTLHQACELYEFGLLFHHLQVLDRFFSLLLVTRAKLYELFIHLIECDSGFD